MLKAYTKFYQLFRRLFYKAVKFYSLFFAAEKLWLFIFSFTGNPYHAMMYISSNQTKEYDPKFIKLCRKKFLSNPVQRNYSIEQMQLIFRVLEQVKSENEIINWIPTLTKNQNGNQLSGWIRVIGIENFSGSHTLSLGPERPYKFQDPAVFGEQALAFEREVIVPAMKIYEIDHADILGAYIIRSNNMIINYEPAAHPSNGFVAGTWNYLLGLKENSDHAFLNFSYSREEYLDSAILIAGRCSTNYFHWLIEYLPRLLAIKNKGQYDNLPLIIDRKLYPQQLEALKLLAPDRALFFYDHSTLLRVKKLIVPSISTHHLDSPEIPFWKSGALSLEHMDFLRNEIASKLNFDYEPIYNKGLKLYIGRKGIRSVVNAPDIEGILVEKGFKIVYPETMSFAEQVKLFNSASVIMGPAGAAFSNIIFCRKDTVIFSFVAEHNKLYPMQANLAKSAGAKYYFITGSVVETKPMTEIEKIHANYKVPLTKIRKAISYLDAIGY